MPKPNPTANRFPAKDCRFAKRHMPADSTAKVWDVMFGFAWKYRERNHGKLLFNAAVKPTLANAVPCHRDTADTAIKWLLKHDWIVLVEKGKRKANGEVSPNTYSLRTHEEYVKLHPDSCPPNPYPTDKNEIEPAKEMTEAEIDQFMSMAPQWRPAREFWSGMHKLKSGQRELITDEEMLALYRVLEPASQSGANRTGDTTSQSGAPRLSQSGALPLASPVPTGLPVRCEPEESFDLITNKQITKGTTTTTKHLPEWVVGVWFDCYGTPLNLSSKWKDKFSELLTDVTEKIQAPIAEVIVEMAWFLYVHQENPPWTVGGKDPTRVTARYFLEDPDSYLQLVGYNKRENKFDRDGLKKQVQNRMDPDYYGKLRVPGVDTFGDPELVNPYDNGANPKEDWKRREQMAKKFEKFWSEHKTA